MRGGGVLGYLGRGGGDRVIEGGCSQPSGRYPHHLSPPVGPDSVKPTQPLNSDPTSGGHRH